MYTYYVYVYLYDRETKGDKGKRTQNDSGKTTKETQKKTERAVKTQRNKSGSSIKRNKSYNNTIYNTYTNT